MKTLRTLIFASLTTLILSGIFLSSAFAEDAVIQYPNSKLGLTTKSCSEYHHCTQGTLVSDECQYCQTNPLLSPERLTCCHHCSDC